MSVPDYPDVRLIDRGHVHTLQAAVVAVGAQGSVHMHGYRRLSDVHLAAVTDIDLVRATAVADEWGIAAYADYSELLAAEQIDVLSVCTPPAQHEQIVLDAIDSGVRAIHCEKPMALTFSGARRMCEHAEERGVLLTINHQRRWDPAYRAARAAVAAGEIGTVQSFEGHCANLFDWGSHLIDLVLYFADDDPPAQVFGQIDVAERRHVYGALVETASICYLHWSDGRNASIFTGHSEPLSRYSDTLLVVHGSKGRLEVTPRGATIRRFDGTQRQIEDTIADEYDVLRSDVDPAVIQGTSLALEDLITCLRDGGRPVLGGRRALATAEIIFATYESSAARRPVELPLGVDDNALYRGLALNYWSPIGESYGTS